MIKEYVLMECRRIENIIFSKIAMKILIALYLSKKPMTKYQLMKKVNVNYKILVDRLNKLIEIGLIEVHYYKPLRYSLSKRIFINKEYEPILKYIEAMSNIIRL
ncbi:MAG: hypothetical protein DRN04_03160 [Thermoprotei archaeon]|nr:MAG: hypothetical protein DRN04_03160 [Thermoprotei archaeon]